MATEISNELKRILVNQETIVKWVSKKLRKQGHHSPPLIQSIDTISTRHFDMPDKLREQLIKKGYSQAKKYSWKKMAEETLKVYDRAL